MHIQKGDLVQFTENHKWISSIGIIDKIEKCGSDTKYLIGVPIPEKGTAFIFSLGSKHEFEVVGKSLFILSEENDEK